MGDCVYSAMPTPRLCVAASPGTLGGCGMTRRARRSWAAHTHAGRGVTVRAWVRKTASEGDRQLLSLRSLRWPGHWRTVWRVVGDVARRSQTFRTQPSGSRVLARTPVPRCRHRTHLTLRQPSTTSSTRSTGWRWRTEIPGLDGARRRLRPATAALRSTAASKGSVAGLQRSSCQPRREARGVGGPGHG
jgi:hypothetical protein